MFLPSRIDEPVSHTNPTRGSVLCALLDAYKKTESTTERDGHLTRKQCGQLARFLQIPPLNDTYYEMLCQAKPTSVTWNDTEPECAIPYCEHELDSSIKLVPVCARHKMHEPCLKEYVKHRETPECPMCRDTTLAVMKELFTVDPYQGRQPEVFDSQWLVEDEEEEDPAMFLRHFLQQLSGPMVINTQRPNSSTTRVISHGRLLLP